MTLASGDLTTLQRASTWLSDPPKLPSNLLTQLIGSMTQTIYSKLNRARIFSQTFTRKFDGTGTPQLMLPDYPVTAINSVQIGNVLVPEAELATATQTGVIPVQTFNGWGFRSVYWSGNLPGDASAIQLVGGYFVTGYQNVIVNYQAGYLISDEPATVPGGAEPTVVVMQPLGIWCRDNGVVYAATSVALTPVAASPAIGQYVPPKDDNPGSYLFSSADVGASLLISYSFIPADLEEACIQMIAERLAYRGRIGEISKSLGGQESVRFMRGGARGSFFPDLPPEVAELITPYVSVIPPAIGAPV